MEKSLFELKRMDCAAEENLVRLRLGEFDVVKYLSFDLPARQVTVFHDGGLSSIHEAIDALGLKSRLVTSVSTNEPIPQEAREERNLLWTVLIINFVFFIIEVLFGVISGSMGLVADSLDMLADALVYGLSLFAVGAGAVRKRSLVMISGYLQLSLAILGLIEVLRRFLGFESLPNFRTMIVVSILALIANSISLYLLQRSGSQEIHMQASMIFTSNDVIINIGVMVAGLLVFWLDSGIPDLVIGTIVFIIVTRGALRILKLGTSTS